MTETNPERVLERLAFGDDWKLDSLGKLIAAVEGVQGKIQGIIETIPQQWQGDAAELALARFRVHQGNLGKYSDALFQAQALVTGQGKTTCSATCANTTRAAEAQRLLNELPSGLVPPWVHDKVNQGGIANIPGIGKFDVNSHMEDISNLFGENRKKAAEQALVSMSKVIDSEAERLRIVIAYDDIPISAFPSETEKVPPFEGLSDVPRGGSGDALPGVSNRPGGSGGNGGGGDDGGNGGGGDDGGNGGGGNGGGGDDGGNGGGGNGGGGNGGGGNGGGNGGGGNDGGNGGSGPSVDSNLDGGGGGLHPGLGVAGLGTVGLAAGAKIASGSGSGLSGLGGVFGGAGGAGGVGAGGGGLRGMAAAAGGGGAGSGAAGSGAAAGAGGRSTGMMGGGGAGGSNQKKGKRVGLGYIAPTLEDEGDGGPAANASRGGRRGGN